MTKRDLRQVFALTRLPGWPLLKAELHGRVLTRLKQQWDKTGEKLAQVSGQAVEAVSVYELFSGFEKLGTEKDETEKDEEED